MKKFLTILLVIFCFLTLFGCNAKRIEKTKTPDIVKGSAQWEMFYYINACKNEIGVLQNEELERFLKIVDVKEWRRDGMKTGTPLIYLEDESGNRLEFSTRHGTINAYEPGHDTPTYCISLSERQRDALNSLFINYLLQ